MTLEKILSRIEDCAITVLVVSVCIAAMAAALSAATWMIVKALLVVKCP